MTVLNIFKYRSVHPNKSHFKFYKVENTPTFQYTHSLYGSGLKYLDILTVSYLLPIKTINILKYLNK